MIPSNDQFWNPDARKDAAKKAVLAKIEQAKRVKTLAMRISAIQAHPSFGQYVKSVRDLREAYLKKIVSEDSVPTLRLAQGAIRAYDEILGCLEKSDDTVRMLDKSILMMQNDLAAMEQQLAQGV